MDRIFLILNTVVDYIFCHMVNNYTHNGKRAELSTSLPLPRVVDKNMQTLHILYLFTLTINK